MTEMSHLKSFEKAGDNPDAVGSGCELLERHGKRNVVLGRGCWTRYINTRLGAEFVRTLLLLITGQHRH